LISGSVLRSQPLENRTAILDNVIKFGTKSARYENVAGKTTSVGLRERAAITEISFYGERYAQYSPKRPASDGPLTPKASNAVALGTPRIAIRGDTI